METSRYRWWETRWFALAAILLSMVPLLWPAIPPLTDLPGHMGHYRVMLGTDAATLGQWYHFQWRLMGNLGVDLPVAALAPLIGLEPAVKLVLIATVGASAAGILWIAREAHGRVTPFALFALPLVYNYSLHFGFVNYAVSMALALNAFALWLRLGRLGRIKLRAALFVPLSCLVWLAHTMGWGVLGLMVYGAELVREREAGRRWIEAVVRAGVGCMPLALPLLLVLVWRTGATGGVNNRFFDIIKLVWLTEILRDRWQSFDLASAFLLFGLLGVAFLGVRDRSFDRVPALARASQLLLAAFLLLPFVLFGSAYADMRVAPFMVMLALLALRPGERQGTRGIALMAFAGLAFFLVRTTATTVSFWQYDREYRAELAALDHLPRGARVVAFVGDTCVSPWAYNRLNHLPGLAIVRRAAFANDQWRMDGAALLVIDAPAMGAFAADPSERVLSEPCVAQWGLKSLDQALQGFPREAFDYVWLLQPPAYDRRFLAGTTPVWRSGTSGLYKIDRNRLSGGARPH